MNQSPTGLAATLLANSGEMWVETIRAVYREEKNRDATSREIAEHLSYIFSQRDGGWDAEKLRAFVRGESAPIPHPNVPGNGLIRTVAVVCQDASRNPVSDVKVTVDDHPPHVGMSNNDGYVAFNGVSSDLSASQLTLEKEGYKPYSVHIDLPPTNVDVIAGPPDSAGENQLAYPSMERAGFDPTNISLRELARIRGAMWTGRANLPFGPRPNRDDNIIALEFIYSYYAADPALAERAIEAYKSRGYTHCCIGPINAQSYHGQYPDIDFTQNFNGFLDWLQFLWDHGLIPIVFLHPDNASLDETKALYTHLIVGNDRAQRLLRIVVPAGWEPTRYDWSSNTWAEYMRWASEILPRALILLHTVSDVDAPAGTDSRGDDNGKGNHTAWIRVAPYIHGWLVQSSSFERPDDHGDPNHPNNTNFDNWASLFDRNQRGSYYDRFHNGYAGWPTNSKWGNEPIKIYAGEYAAYWSYWQNRPEAESQKWGDRAISVGADGYLDGGTVDVP